MRKKISMVLMTVFFLIPVYIRCNDNFCNTNSIAGDAAGNARAVTGDSVIIKPRIKPIPSRSLLPSAIVARDIPIDSIVEFAKTLIGTPYLYGSSDPLHGFDCSGFITYVFNHFLIHVPRSSRDFTNVGEKITAADSKKGDLILFTGENSSERLVGHIGIIISNNNGDIQFIHASSGKAKGVVITPLNDYYKGRLLRVIRLSLLA